MTASLLVFVLAAAALLGSPGPGIAALMAVGRARGVAGGLRYYAAMQLGLAIAAALSAFGVVTLIQALPVLHKTLTIASVVYLVWLAWAIATAPLSGNLPDAVESRAFKLTGGFMLGFANPKAYLAFASLFGSFAIVDPPYGFRDGLIKWIGCVAVMALVDMAWLLVGVALGRIRLPSSAERTMNITMGAAILVACLATVLRE